MKGTVEERFWAKVQKSRGCWLWTAGCFADGYGTFRKGSKMCRAHRVSWELAYGTIPPGQLVLHTCDTPRCVKPTHLFLGTDADNAADRDTKGRQPVVRGEAHGSAKLTKTIVRAIRRAATTQTQQEIATRYGIAKATVYCVVKRKTWAHVT